VEDKVPSHPPIAWTKEEDKRLYDVIQIYGTSNWDLICDIINTNVPSHLVRTKKQVQERGEYLQASTDRDLTITEQPATQPVFSVLEFIRKKKKQVTPQSHQGTMSTSSMSSPMTTTTPPPVIKGL
jgi:hypothetical protein